MSTTDNDEFDPSDEDVDVIVPDGLDNVRVDRALSLLTGLSRSNAHLLIDARAVFVDGREVTKSSTLLESGQRLVASLPEPRSDEVTPDPSVHFDVVYEDTSFVIVNKPPGVVVHPGAGQRDGTLVAGLLARYPEMAELVQPGVSDVNRPGIVHRLDKGTSGLLVAARRVDAFLSLKEQLADRTMQRTYLGLVEGHVEEERGVVDAPIGRSSRVPTMMAVRRDGRPARTGYRVLQRRDEPRASTFLELKLETGRTHQIRVHLATIGHPVVNDTRYGHRREKRLDPERLFLHATSLGLVHPVTGEPVFVSAALPTELSALLDD